MAQDAKLYGVAAEYRSPGPLLAALRAVRERGYAHVDVHSPLPLQGADEALELRPPLLGRIAVAGVLLGGCGCFAMCVYATVWNYPFNVAGRPLFSWPYFVIPSFASAMAVGAIAVAVGMLFLDRLPRLNHPAFNIDDIDGVTQDRMFLVVEARSDDFDPAAVEHMLRALPERPRRIQRVPR